MATTFAVVIDGVDRTTLVEAGSLIVDITPDDKNSATFVLKTDDRSDLPSNGQTVLISVGGNPKFGGFISRLPEQGIDGATTDAVEVRVQCTSYSAYWDRRFPTFSWAGGTLKAFATTLVSYGATYGISLDAGMADGPTVPAQDFNAVQLSAIIDQMLKQFGWLPRTSPTKVFGFYEPTADAAPFNVSKGSNQVQDISVERSQEARANRILLSIGDNSTKVIQQFFNGDGSTTEFNLDYQVAAGNIGGYATRGVVWVDGGSQELDSGASPRWTVQTYTDDQEQRRYKIVTTGTPPAAGTNNVWLEFTAQFPMIVVAEDAADIAANGLWERPESAPTVFDVAVGQELADQYLVKGQSDIEQAAYQTDREDDLFPGMSQTVDIDVRGISAAAPVMLTELEIRDLGNQIVQQVKTVGGEKVKGDWRDFWKQMDGGSGQTSVGSQTVVDAGGGGAAAHLPQGGVQVYKDGTLYATDHFTVDPDDLDSGNVLIGTGHTPGGADNLLVGAEHTVN